MMLSLLWACATTPQIEVQTAEMVVSDVPVPGELPNWKPPVPTVMDMENGAALWVHADNSLPLVSIRWVFPGGSGADPEGAAGSHFLAGRMMQESSGGRDAMAVTRAFEVLAASTGIRVNRQSTVVSLDVASERLDEALALIADQIVRPAFSREDWQRVRDQHLLTLQQERQETSSLAREVAHQLYFGSSLLGRPVSGTPKGIEKLSLESVKGAYLSGIRPGGAAIVVVGDVDLSTIKERLEKVFSGWEGQIEMKTPSEAQDGRPGLFVVNDPGATQTSIRALGEGPKAGHVDRLAATATAVVIGGSFTSRLNYLMREKKGYTYGAWAAFSAAKDFGYFSASSSVRQNATVEALTDMYSVFDSADEPYSEMDQKKARSQLFSDEVGTAATRSKLAGVYVSRFARGLRPDGWAKELELSMSTSATDMQVIGSRFINRDKMTVVLAGDVDAITPALKAANIAFEVVEPVP